MDISLIHLAGIFGNLLSSGITTGTLPSSFECGRKKLKYATKSVTFAIEPVVEP